MKLIIIKATLLILLSINVTSLGKHKKQKYRDVGVHPAMYNQNLNKNVNLDQIALFEFLTSLGYLQGSVIDCLKTVNERDMHIALHNLIQYVQKGKTEHLDKVSQIISCPTYITDLPLRLSDDQFLIPLRKKIKQYSANRKY